MTSLGKVRAPPCASSIVVYFSLRNAARAFAAHPIFPLPVKWRRAAVNVGSNKWEKMRCRHPLRPLEGHRSRGSC
jgi:hypothetical protein